MGCEPAKTAKRRGGYGGIPLLLGCGTGLRCSFLTMGEGEAKMDVIPDEPIVIASLLSLALLGILILNLAGRGSGDAD